MLNFSWRPVGQIEVNDNKEVVFPPTHYQIVWPPWNSLQGLLVKNPGHTFLTPFGGACRGSLFSWGLWKEELELPQPYTALPTSFWGSLSCLSAQCLPSSYSQSTKFCPFTGYCSCWVVAEIRWVTLFPLGFCWQASLEVLNLGLSSSFYQQQSCHLGFPEFPMASLLWPLATGF